MITKKYNLKKIYKKLNKTVERINKAKGYLSHSVVLKDNKIIHKIAIPTKISDIFFSSVEYSITEDEFIEGYLNKELFEEFYFKLKKEWKWLKKKKKKKPCPF